ncbi:hypothetical protein BRD00_03055 [Halobacteriales archaeon QS_8_69_26]|nr:MAG: hypothetical protein BRD00_03055 [Halobacteriales archaeon QS_8_69_26]
MSRLAALAATLLLVTAGCVTPTTNDPERTPSGEDIEGDIEVDGPPIGVDPDGVYARVLVVLDADADPPARIRVFDPDEFDDADDDGTDNDSTQAISLRPSFWEAMGVERDPEGLDDPTAMESGATSALGQVALFLGDNETTAVHYVLAHELVHYVQFAQDRHRSVLESVDADTTDGQFVYRSVLEGAAVYATDAYIRRYVDTDETNSGVYPRLAEQLEPGSIDRYGNDQYVLGHRYVADRVDDPRDLPAVYEDPPRTAEQVIHGHPPGAEPPRDLSVTVEEGDYFFQGTDRMGEAWLRTALRNGVDESAATRAAEGWGNDSLLTFRPSSGESSYAWVLRFDDAENRSGFDDVFADYLDARGDRTGDRWAVEDYAVDYRPVGEDTAVVLVGTEAFVDGATVEGSSGEVTVAAPSGTDDGDGAITPDSSMVGNGPIPAPAPSVAMPE